MVNVHRAKFTDRFGTKGEIRIGWASWDNEEHKAASVKWAYPMENGNISRGSPEVPMDVLVEMVKEVFKHEDFLPQKDKSAIEKLRALLQ